MLKNFIVVLITFAFGCFLYGARYIFLEVEENACRMTYMFGEPQFLKLKFKENKEFPHYGLYYYYEGSVQQNIKYLKLRGAPVLFVPGNAGSFKQVRSLASVALQKALDNERNIQLNYFAIDFKEQLSGFYGGYLEDQKMFLKLCIQVVSNIYEKNKSVIIIGHSMGGKVAQAVLEQRGDFTKINSIIFISSPLDIPVINLDYEIQKFYVNNEKFLSINRERYLAHNETNTCVDLYQNVSYFRSESSLMENILMISIGGGNRDLMVQESLTMSKYSDIHAMTSSIPKVWLSCDHLSSVWCLQLVKVINRFIFAVATVDSRNDVFYLDEKSLRVQAAINYFVKPLNRHKVIELYFNNNYESVWDEQSKIVYGKLFKNGLRHYYNQLLTIHKYKDYKKLFMEVTGLDDNNWLFACLETFHEGNSLGCNKGIPISHYIQNIPAQDTFRSVSLIDVEHVLKYYPSWTHIMIRLPPTNKKVSFKIDVYKANERKIIVKAPRFFFARKVLITETTHATMHYMILIQDLEEPISTLRFDIEPIACVDKRFQITGKICVPWVRGFERYKHFSDKTLDKGIYVNVPIPTPTGYNTSVNPVCLELFLDPPCRYKISYQLSIAATASKIVQESYHWLPAHLTSVLFIILKHEIVNFQNPRNSWFIKPYVGFFQYKSFYILTACRLLRKLLTPFEILPSAAISNSTIYILIVIHSTAIVVSILFVFIIWIMLVLNGNLLYKVAFKLVGVSMPLSNVLTQMGPVLPLSFGIVFISIACASCSGIALALASIFYFVTLSNTYKGYLQSWVLENLSELHTKSSNEHNDTRSCNYCEGLMNLPFHTTMLLLLITMTVMNCGVTIAWMKSESNVFTFSDPFLLPAIIVLLCISILLQLNAPHKSSGYHIVVIMLYFCASACILYCQEHIFGLKYTIALVYVLITLQEVFHCIIKR